MAQFCDLLRRKPPGFAVFAGEDAVFHRELTQEADGGIIATAHVGTHGLRGRAVPALAAAVTLVPLWVATSPQTLLSERSARGRTSSAMVRTL